MSQVEPIVTDSNHMANSVFKRVQSLIDMGTKSDILKRGGDMFPVSPAQMRSVHVSLSFLHVQLQLYKTS